MVIILLQLIFWLLRMAFVSIPSIIALSITVAVFMYVPFVRDAVELALDKGGSVFVLAVIVPSGILVVIVAGLSIKILWRISKITRIRK